MNLEKIKNLLVVLVFSIYVLPYPGLMPGNRLYRLKEIADRVSQFWAFGNFSRHKYELALADKKLVEAKILFEYQQYPLALKALTNSNIHFQKAVYFLGQAEREGKNISQKSKNFKAAAEKHKEVLGKLKKELPGEFLWQPEKKPAEKLEIHQFLEEAIKNREV